MQFVLSANPKIARGVVLVTGGAGSLVEVQLKKTGTMRYLVVPGHGHPGGAALLRMRKPVAEGSAKQRVQFLTDRLWPWSLATPLAARDIEKFAETVFDK